MKNNIEIHDVYIASFLSMKVSKWITGLRTPDVLHFMEARPITFDEVTQ